MFLCGRTAHECGVVAGGVIVVGGVFAVMTFFMLLFINKLYHDDTTQSTSTPGHFNAWKSKDAWYLGVYMGIQSLLFYTVASFLPSIGMGYGLSLTQASGLALTF